MAKMLTVLARPTSNSQTCLRKKCTKATHIFSAKLLAYMPYLMIKVFDDTLTNDSFSFEKLGPGLYNLFILNIALLTCILCTSMCDIFCCKN